MPSQGSSAEQYVITDAWLVDKDGNEWKCQPASMAIGTSIPNATGGMANFEKTGEALAEVLRRMRKETI